MLMRKRICYFIVCILFILYLIFANTIIAALKKNNFTKSSIDIFRYKKDRTFYGIDDINFHDDVFDSFDYSGWTFCETNTDNNNKEVWLLLYNDSFTYMHKTELMKRIDVVGAFKKDYSIKGTYHGTYGTFSTVGVKNGTYKLYIYCKENNENYGLVDTGRMLKKDSSGICEYIWESSLCNVLETKTGENVKSNIDSASINDKGYLQIQGWAFVEGLDSTDQTIYIRLTYKDNTTVTYSTQSVSRPDVGTAYKSDLYDNSGFKALIPVDKLQDGDKKIEILISNGTNIYLVSKVYQYSDSSLALKNAENISKEVTLDTESITGDNKVKYTFDSCLADKNLTIKGWAFINEMESSKTSIFLAITSADGKKRVFNSIKISRPDVAEFYKNELYKESGFKAVIPLNAIAEGDNTITVIADNGQMLKAPTSYTFNYKAGDNN